MCHRKLESLFLCACVCVLCVGICVYIYMTTHMYTCIQCVHKYVRTHKCADILMFSRSCWRARLKLEVLLFSWNSIACLPLSLALPPPHRVSFSLNIHRYTHQYLGATFDTLPGCLIFELPSSNLQYIHPYGIQT